MTRLMIRTQGTDHVVIGGCAGHVAAPMGKVHQAADKSMKTLCGLTFITYVNDPHTNSEHGLSWPTTTDAVTCKNCLRHPDPFNNFGQRLLADLKKARIDLAASLAEDRKRRAGTVPRPERPYDPGELQAHIEVP
jgi:hypothetical protein